MKQSIKAVNINRKRKVSTASVKKIAGFVLRKFYKKRKEIILNIILASDSYLKRLNRIYKSKNRLTDVLCFPMDKGADIYISSDRAAVNSKRFGLSFKHEIYLYTIHGVLHMLGFRDNTKSQKKRMEKVEHRLLEELRDI
ncbi:MAG: rRNA maturation RNase YbeY [Candidatus Omnitrophica bacterium]|nr:rRNA maturation RNase YbeY [Candidatus Omnitrophota bacterium]